MKTIFHVWELKNGELLTGGERKLVAEIEGTKRALKRFVAHGQIIPTHMGETQKTKDGYFYFTTIGRTYHFQRSNMTAARKTFNKLNKEHLK